MTNLPELTGILSTLPPHTQACVKAYALDAIGIYVQNVDAIKQEPAEWQGRILNGTQNGSWQRVAPTKQEPTAEQRVRYLQTLAHADGTPAYEFRALYTVPPGEKTELEHDAVNMLFALRDAWSYVHQWCTIESIRERHAALMRKHGDFADFWNENPSK